MSSLFFKQGDISKIATSSDNIYPNVPGTKLNFLNEAPLEIIPLQDGCLYFAKDSVNTKAYIYLDADSKRYVITGPVDWSEIYNKPSSFIVSDIIFEDTGLTDDDGKKDNDINGKQKRLEVYDIDKALMKNIRLPFLYANQKDTITAPITLSGGDGDSSGKFIITPNLASQITDHGTRTLFGFINKYTNPDSMAAGTIPLTIGHGQYSMLLRSTSSEATSDKEATYDYRPTIYAQANNNTSCTKRTVAYLEDIIPKAECDSEGNIIKDSYVGYNTISITDKYTLNYGNNNSGESSVSLTDYYIGSLGPQWISNSTTSTLDINLNYYKNGALTTDITPLTLSIPAATSDVYGIVTNSDQSFAGVKYFTSGLDVGAQHEETVDIKVSVHGAIGLGPNDNVKIHYNYATESLDFSF